MCNRYANTISYSQYLETFKQIGIPLVSPAAPPNLEPLQNIAPTNIAPVLRPVEGGIELCRLRWGLIPWFHQKAIKEWKMLTTNARYETLKTTRSFKSAFEKRRCLIPCTRFYEWTGEKGRKTKWNFSRTDKDWFCFAGLWDRAHTADGDIESYALVTTEAGPDVVAYHNRQPIILERSDYRAWLNTGELRAAIVKPPEAGILKVEPAAQNSDKKLILVPSGAAAQNAIEQN